MGQCYSSRSSVVNDVAGNGNGTLNAAVAGDQAPAPSTSGRQTPAGPSPWPSPYPVGVNPTPSPARTPGRRMLRWPFPPPSPARPIMALMRRRKASTAGEGSAPATPAPEREEDGSRLDRNFGYPKNFGAKYELGKEVGRGHFGHTCFAKGKKGELKGQNVAVKIISKSKMTSAIAIEDVRREVKILKALSGHKHMLKFHDAFEDSNNVYLVMELCEGGELLDRILQRGGRYTEEDAKGIVVQILSAAAFCHLQGVVHRDLKPENFLFATKDEDATLKVIDFGLSDYVKPDQRLNDVVGSAYYVAPRVDPNFDDAPWPTISKEGKDFVKRLLNKDHRKRMTAAQALAHPWLREKNCPIPLDILVYKSVKAYVRAMPFKRAALKALSKALTENELFYLNTQFRLLEPKGGRISLENFKMAFMRNATDAMKESRVGEILTMMDPLSAKKMDFEEFCVASISVYQLEALEDWDRIAATAFEFFEQEGNRVISPEELAREMNLVPAAYSLVKDWIRSSDGKLNFIGYTKFLHGVTIRNSNARRQ